MTTDKKTNFAKSYGDLEKIVKWFEKDDVNLEEGIEKFEEGMKIVKDLKKYLDSMENKVRDLKKEMV